MRSQPATRPPPTPTSPTPLTHPHPSFHFCQIAALASPSTAAPRQQHHPRSGPRSRKATKAEEASHSGGHDGAGEEVPSAPSLPPELYQLLDPSSGVALPSPAVAAAAWGTLDNRELDKLVAALGRSKATWRRALLLHEWLAGGGHTPDARLATTLIRVAAQHGASVTALGLYDWMRAPAAEGGAGLEPSVYTYTAAMRAGLAGGLLDRAAGVWGDALAAGAAPGDARLATAFLEVCGRRGDADGALGLYRAMRAAPRASALAPTVHTYTAAMRAAASGGRWGDALAVWSDLEAAGVRPTGHAYAAAISACAGAGEWRRAVDLFEGMLGRGVKPDVVSCTALVGALGAAGQAPAAERVVSWMLASGVRPNARTYSALLEAFGAGREWGRAVALLGRMMEGVGGAPRALAAEPAAAALDPPLPAGLGAGVPPNAYTMSAFLKAAGDQGKWELADAVFTDLEAAALEASSGGGSSGGGGGADKNQRAASLVGLITPTPTGESPPGGLAAAVAEHVLAGEGGVEVGGLAGWAARSAPGGGAQPLVWPKANGGGTGAGGGGTTTTTSRFPWAASAASAAAAAAAADGVNPWSTDPPEAPTTPPKSALTAQLAALPADDLIEGAVVGRATAGGAGGRAASPSPSSPSSSTPPTWSPRSALNEVVCGAFMAALERAGQARAAVRVLDRARALGIPPNTVMHNTALAALGRVGRWREAEALFRSLPESGRDGVTHETMVAAYGLAGEAARAEAALVGLVAAGHGPPRDYAWVALIAGHSVSGDWRAALGVQARMAASGVAPTVHVFNALLAACERAGRWETAVAVQAGMASTGVAGDSLTARLLAAVGRGGVSAVEDQQLAAAALSAALAAAGGLIMRAGFF